MGIMIAIGLTQIAKEIEIDNKIIFLIFCLKKFMKKKFEIRKKLKK